MQQGGWARVRSRTAQLVPLHSDYDTLAVFGYARAIFSRARCVVNIQLIRAPEPLRWRSQASISETSRSRLPIRRSRHCPRSTPISISTMLSQLACVLHPAVWTSGRGYAASLRSGWFQAARAAAGLWYPFLAMSQSAL